MHDADSVRKRALAARNALSPSERTAKSRQIHRHFFDLTDRYDVKSYFLFVSFSSEVETRGLIDHLLKKDKIVSVPLVSVKDRKMTAIRLINPEQDLVPGYGGIPEPRANIAAERRVDHGSIDIVVLPGSAFDRRGARLGYGGGFYDRFLAHQIQPSALRVALAFEVQIQDEVPQQTHDMPVDYIVTEQGVITCGSRIRR